MPAIAGIDIVRNSCGTTEIPGTGCEVPRNLSGTALVIRPNCDPYGSPTVARSSVILSPSAAQAPEFTLFLWIVYTQVERPPYRRTALPMVHPTLSDKPPPRHQIVNAG